MLFIVVAVAACSAKFHATNTAGVALYRVKPINEDEEEEPES